MPDYLVDGRRTLGILAWNSDWAELRKECDAGRDLNAAAEFRFGCSPLSSAVRQGASRGTVPEDLVRRMVVTHGADLGWVDDGMTALHYAASNRALSGRIVRALVELGAPVDAHTTAESQGRPSGSTALNLAALNGNTDAVEILLTFGADATLRDGEGATALENAE